MSEKTARQCIDFSNRLQKKYKHLKKWAKRNQITCFRLYDNDIPEIPVVLDIYQSESSAHLESNLFAYIALYERPYEKDEKEEDEWFLAIINATSTTLQIPPEHIFTKTRKKQRGLSQYEKTAKTNATIPIQECGMQFTANLSDYLDTGLFFDHRPLRNIIKNECCGKSVLNLFCYTGSFSVYAACGGARSVTSVDLSKTYLKWAEEHLLQNVSNIYANGKPFDKSNYRYIHSDVIQFLINKCTEKANTQNRWDIIILDPPTFSNSKRATNVLDINQDWAKIVNACFDLLNPEGVLYFSTNSKGLKFDSTLVNLQAQIRDITTLTIPEDFKDKKPHRCWKIEKRGQNTNTKTLY